MYFKYKSAKSKMMEKIIPCYIIKSCSGYINIKESIRAKNITRDKEGQLIKIKELTH
jgi:hypothetical protein